MAYADTHPVHSILYATDHSPVTLLTSGQWDEHYEVERGMEIEEDIPNANARANPNPDPSSGCTDWDMTDPDESPPILLCIDTNVFISQLPLVQSIHALLVSLYPTTPSPISFLVPLTVRKELDGLKASSKPVGYGARSDRTATVGELAQRANRWLFDVKRRERVERVGKGLVRGDAAFEKRTEPSADNDARIVQSALSSQTFSRVIFWTEDIALATHAEFAELETIPPSYPSTARDFLLRLGLTLPCTPTPTDEREEPMDLDGDPFYALFQALAHYLPPSTERHLRSVERFKPVSLENAVRPWAIEVCLDGLAKVWGHEQSRWGNHEFGTPSFLGRPQAGGSFQSRYAPAQNSSGWINPNPSPAYVRMKLFPAQAAFWRDLPRAREMPSREQWADALRALELLFRGSGGERFLGRDGYRVIGRRIDAVWNSLR